MRSFNFSFGGQDLFHINSIIKTICKKKNNLKFILIYMGLVTKNYVSILEELDSPTQLDGDEN